MIRNEILNRCASHIQGQERLDPLAGHMIRSMVFEMLGHPATAAVASKFLGVYERFDRALADDSEDVEALRDDCLAMLGSLRRAAAVSG